MMSSLRAPDAARLLHGMSIAEAFRAFVLGDPEVVQLSKPISNNNRIRYMLAEGQSPGPMGDFLWPMDATPGSIAYLFVSNAIDVSFWGQPSPSPSPAIQAISAVLADRIGTLRSFLTSGQLVASGTFEKTGTYGPIDRQQWGRAGIFVDMQKGDLCEGPRYPAEPRYTGITLRCLHGDELAQSPSVAINVDTRVKSETQARTSGKSKMECFAWLCGLMRASPTRRTFSKDELLKKAQKQWPGLSENAFDGLRRRAIEETGASAWGFAGAPRKL